MTFDPNASLDPSQVEDLRGSRVGGRGLAAGGGGLGLIVVIVWVLLGGSPSTGGAIGGLVDQAVGAGEAGDPLPASSALANDCLSGANANAREDCRIVGYVNSIQAYWAAVFRASNLTYQPSKTRFFTGQMDTGVRRGDRGRRAVLLPGRPVHLHRSRLLRRAPLALRGDRWAVRRGLRHRPRVRPPRPGPARRAQARERDRSRQPGRTDRAPGRLLRRRLGEQRRGDEVPPAPDRCPDRRRIERRRGGRRRPHPEPGPGPGRPRELDPRLAPPSARSGSRPATGTATRTSATRSPGTPDRSRRATRDRPSR